MGKALKYKPYDFRVITETGDPRVPYSFESLDGKVTANFFWIPGNVEVRGMVGEDATIHITMPLANPINNPQHLPKAKDVLAPIIRKLERREYD